jgi:hypothetical protein
MLVVGHGRVLGLGVLVAGGDGSGSLAAGRGCRLCSLAAVVEGIPPVCLRFFWFLVCPSLTVL